ncbi:class F sortase [Solwaraspora sp. WMMD406]|uniref:class F sortase n=1 Tax=Solwaraspora sp. WMMD406 TaxID=3016095 RepID=UPI002415B065|nr:class F sortase [Solwaraspora sp. WMMD406]MDG4764568.1 class F sortase [Solwaraspora sp. WMMD406]
MAVPAPTGGRARGWLIALATQIGTAGTTPHTVAAPVTTYGRPQPAPAEQTEPAPTEQTGQPQAAPLPAIPGTARGIARAPVRGVAAVPGRAGPTPGGAGRRPGPARPRGRGWWGVGGGKRRSGRRPGPGGSTRPGGAGTGRRRTGGRSGWGPAALALVLFGIFAVGIGFERVTGTTLAHWLPGGHRSPTKEYPAMPASDPVSLDIPALNLQAAVHDVGMTDDGTIEVPELDRHNEAGWYVASPTPGENGPSVIVGHVDTRTGPSVFHQAGTLHPGAQIQIRRVDGSVAVFEVNSVERFDKSSLPVQRVYADFSRPGLRLITCGGRWVGGDTGYADNVVVFASLVDAREG